MRQIHLKCPYCSKEGYVPLDMVQRFIHLNQVKEPVSLPCGACAALHANQATQRPLKGRRLWNWFDRLTHRSIIAKVIVAMIPVTATICVVGYTNHLIENHPVIAFIIAILLFCEGLFLLGLLVNVPYDYGYDVVLNPAFKDLEVNAWHKREIGQL